MPLDFIQIKYTLIYIHRYWHVKYLGINEKKPQIQRNIRHIFEKRKQTPRIFELFLSIA